MKYQIRTLIFVSGLCLTTSAPAFAQAGLPQYDQADWQPLFNGENLEGWRVKIRHHDIDDNFAQTFRVEDGLLKVRYDGYDTFNGQFGHLFHAQSLSHYALSITYRFVGEQASGGPRGWALRNSGVMLHTQAPETMTLKQEFPISIEAQFLGGLSDGNSRPTANVCTPGTDIVYKDKLFKTHCLNSTSETYDADQWVTVTVVVLGGGSITHYVNGTQVLKYEQPQLDDAKVHAKASANGQSGRALSSGYIALQSESHPIDFKSVQLLNLKGCTNPSATNYRPYYVSSADDSCEF